MLRASAVALSDPVVARLGRRVVSVGGRRRWAEARAATAELGRARDRQRQLDLTHMWACSAALNWEKSMV